MIPTKDEVLELLMRSFWTFVKTFLATLTAAGTGVVQLDALQMAAISGLGAVISVVQIYAAQKLSAEGNSAKLLRGANDATSSATGTGTGD